MSKKEFVKLKYPNDTTVTIEGDREVITAILRSLEGKFISVEIGERIDISTGWNVQALRELLEEEDEDYRMQSIADAKAEAEEREYRSGL